MKDQVIKQLNMLDQSLQRGWRMQRDTCYLWNTVLQENPAFLFYTFVCIQVTAELGMRIRLTSSYICHAISFLIS